MSYCPCCLYQVNKSNGPFDAVFCVGQFFPLDGSGVEVVEAYFKGEKSIPLPTYFIGDYGEGAHALLAPARSKALDMGFATDGIPVCDNLFWLKGSGILGLKGRGSILQTVVSSYKLMVSFLVTGTNFNLQLHEFWLFRFSSTLSMEVSRWLYLWYN